MQIKKDIIIKDLFNYQYNKNLLINEYNKDNSTLNLGYCDLSKEIDELSFCKSKQELEFFYIKQMNYIIHIELFVANRINNQNLIDFAMQHYNIYREAFLNND